MTDMFKCNDCGCVFHSSEFKIIYEDRGEFWGMPAREPMAYCPNCEGDDYDEMSEEEVEEMV